jgi:hypothetical protein
MMIVHERGSGSTSCIHDERASDGIVLKDSTVAGCSWQLYDLAIGIRYSRKTSHGRNRNRGIMVDNLIPDR